MAFLPLIDNRKVKLIVWEMKGPQSYPNYPYQPCCYHESFTEHPDWTIAAEPFALSKRVGSVVDRKRWTYDSPQGNVQDRSEVC